MILPNGIWLLWAWVWLLGTVGAATYKMAVIGPWSCDTLFARALPGVAANLALSRLRNDPSLSRGFRYDVSIVTEPCSTSEALARFAELEGYGHAFLGPFNPAICSAASLLASNWKAGLASPGCLDEDWPSLAPLPPAGRLLFSVLRSFRWAHVGVVCAPTDLWEATGQEVASSLRALGVPVGPVVTMDTGREGPSAALKTIREADKVKVVIMCMSSVLIGGEEQQELLLAALDLGMASDGYVFLPYDTLLYALPYQDAPFPMLTNHTRLRQAYDAVVTVTMDSDRSFQEVYRQAQLSRELRSSVPAHQVSPLFGTIYNAVYFVAKAVEERRQAGGGRWVSGAELVKSEGGFEFQGFNQMVSGGRGGEGMQARYVILDSGGGDRLRPTHSLEPAHTHGTRGWLRPLARSIHFPGGRPPSSSFCWFSPDTACTGGMSGWTVFFLFDLICLLGVAAWFVYKRGRGRRIGGVNSKLILTLDDLIFINTQVSRKKMNEDSMLTSVVDLKTPFHSVSGRSYLQTSPESSNIAMMEGDCVWMKKCPKGETVSEINNSTKTLFNQLRQMRHENVNLYLGLFLDSGVFAMVMEHCPRGSLSDLLADADLRLDWMFKSSLLMDLIKGMKYLHMRGLSHGRLKSRNCLVDGRFVLKISDYGYPMILHSQSLTLPEEPEGQKVGSMQGTRSGVNQVLLSIFARDRQHLLWTAPELLRSPQRGGSFQGDVYSFAIITHEVISRTPPYASIDMPAQEIIDRVRSPTPLCRPCVSVDEAPLECLSLMQQCWSEEPDRRPNFQEIFKQFKNVNRGKRANIIDSMLRMLEQYSSNLEDLIRERTDELEVERAKTDKLVGQLLPRSVALALKKGKTVQPEHFSESTLYFSDIVGFTTISALSEPMEVVDLLNDLYTMFDAIIASHDVYKVETIGDAYMVASGVPNRNGNRHAAEVANMSLDILHSIGTFRIRHMPEIKVKIRIGLHSGPVVAGVVGLTMPRYCLFGDTVTTASSMEANGLPYRIHIHLSTVKILMSLKQGYKFDTRVSQAKGTEDTYWLLGRDGFTKPLPIPPDLTGGARNHGISIEEIPVERRQKFLDRQKKIK